MSLSDVTRRMFDASDKKRDAGLTTPDDIIRFDDISYGEFEKWNLLDVYRPKNINNIEVTEKNNSKSTDMKSLPVIVSCHGGGWVYGDKDVYQYYCMSLAERGFAVVNYSYRLAPEYRFPASVLDTDSVFRWINAHSMEYGFDTDNVFAVGDSAGANLLGIYLNLMDDEKYVEKVNAYMQNKAVDNEKSETYNKIIFKPQDNLKIKAVSLNCGKYSFTSEKNNAGLKDLARFLFEDNGTDEELDLIDVITHVNENFPPAYVMTATGDFLMKDAGKLCSRLEDIGVTFEYHFYADGEKPLGHVFHCNMRLDMASVCNDDECRFFRKYIG